MKETLITSPTPSEDDIQDEAPFRMTHRQSAALIASTIIGVGVLTLPRSTTSFAAQNGWISTLLGACLTMVLLSIISVLIRRHPGLTMVGIGKELFTPGRHKRIGLILTLPFLLSYAVYWASGTALVARVFGEVVTTTVLKRTPLEVIISTMLITAFILVMHNLEVLVRVNEVLLPLIVIPLGIIGLSSLQSAQLVNILPLFHVNIGAFFKGTLLTATSFLGFELLMMFGAVSEQSGKPMRYHLMGIAIPGLVYSLIVFSGIAVFGVEEIRLLAWPTLELVKTTEVPGLILERVESAFLAVWVAAVFTTLGSLYYGTCMLLKEILGLKSHRWIALGLLPLFYWTSLRAPNIQVLFDIMAKWDLFGLFNASVIPLFFLIVSFIRFKNIKNKKDAVNSAADSSALQESNGQKEAADCKADSSASQESNEQMEAADCKVDSSASQESNGQKEAADCKADSSASQESSGQKEAADSKADSSASQEANGQKEAADCKADSSGLKESNEQKE